MDTSEQALRLRVPATQDYLATIRLFGAAAATHLGADTDSAEDLRLALSEASGLAMAGVGTDCRIEITLAPTGVGRGIQVGVRRQDPSTEDAEHRDPGDQHGAGDLALALLQALVTDLSVEGGERPTSLTFRLELGEDVSDTLAPAHSTNDGRPTDG